MSNSLERAMRVVNKRKRAGLCCACGKNKPDHKPVRKKKLAYPICESCHKKNRDRCRKYPDAQGRYRLEPLADMLRLKKADRIALALLMRGKESLDHGAVFRLIQRGLVTEQRKPSSLTRGFYICECGAAVHKEVRNYHKAKCLGGALGGHNYR